MDFALSWRVFGVIIIGAGLGLVASLFMTYGWLFKVARLARFTKQSGHIDVMARFVFENKDREVKITLKDGKIIIGKIIEASYLAQPREIYAVEKIDRYIDLEDYSIAYDKPNEDASVYQQQIFQSPRFKYQGKSERRIYLTDDQIAKLEVTYTISETD